MLEKLLEGWRGVWLLPFIHVMREKRVFRVNELSRVLGVRSVVVKSAVYALRRLGVVEKRGEGVYAVSEEALREYDSLFKWVVMEGRHYLAYTGSHYIYARVKDSRVSAWVLPEYIVARVGEAARRHPGARPSEIGRMLGLHGRTVSRALLVLRLSRNLQRVEDEGSLGNRA